jgi:hypothetical protein
LSPRWTAEWERWARASSLGLMLAAVAVPAGAGGAARARSQWVSFDHSGKLTYRRLSSGDRIIDFSYAGYMGGGVALPAVPVKKTIAASGGDDSAAIQAAINEVSQLPLMDGARGAVLLQVGHFHCSETLHISASGVVLQGSGPGEAETVLELTGEPHVAITMTGTRQVTPLGVASTVADAYVAEGSMSFRVQDAAGFAVGTRLRL